MQFAAASMETDAALTSPLALGLDSVDWSELDAWLLTAQSDYFAKCEPFRIFLATVNRPAQIELTDHLAKHHPSVQATSLSNADFPLSLNVEQPDRVGSDRVASALAARHLRKANHAAIVVDAGTAINIDGISAKGHFVGGAILPGWNMSARALAKQTDLLPNIEANSIDQAPEALGKSTIGAIRSGLYWGSVGAVKEIVARVTSELDSTEPQLFITGGGGEELAKHLDTVRFEPCLVLQGIALAAKSRLEKSCDH